MKPLSHVLKKLDDDLKDAVGRPVTKATVERLYKYVRDHREPYQFEAYAVATNTRAPEIRLRGKAGNVKFTCNSSYRGNEGHLPVAEHAALNIVQNLARRPTWGRPRCGLVGHPR